MTTIHAIFDDPNTVRKALAALSQSGAADTSITVSATDPSVESALRGPANDKPTDAPEPSTMAGAATGAAAGTVAGAALTAAAAVALPAAAPIFVLMLGGAAMGAMGGSVAGAILGGGQSAKEDPIHEELRNGRILVTVVAPDDRASAFGATLAQCGGRVETTHTADA